MSSRTPFIKAVKKISSSLKSGLTTRNKSQRTELIDTNTCSDMIRDFGRYNYESFVSDYFSLNEGTDEHLFEELPLTLHSLLTETFRLDSDKDEFTNLVELSCLFNETLTNLK